MINPLHLRFIREEAQHSDDPAAAEADMVARYEAGEPLQYVLGTWDFRSLRLKIDRRVLIPRPETEQVVEAAIAAMAGRSDITALDLGTGSGAIALSLAGELGAVVHAVDASADALDVARVNAERLAIDVTFHEGSWFEPLPTDLRFDLIVSNPPYVGTEDEVEPVVLAWEPHGALFAGGDGLADVRHIVEQAPKWLRPGGHLFVEFAPTQARVVFALASRAGFTHGEVGFDLVGRKRWLHARL